MSGKILFFGLGNADDKYIENRHNAGHQFIDYLSQKFNAGLARARRLSCFFSKIKIGGKDVFLAKNDSYMNLSGNSLKKIADYYHVKQEEIFIAYDELDIPLGKFKIQKGIFSKLHKGVASAGHFFDLDKMNFIRIGVNNRGRERIPGEAYVLQDFSENEKIVLKQVFEKIFGRVKDFILGALVFLFPAGADVLAQEFSFPAGVLADAGIGWMGFLIIGFIYLTLLHFGIGVRKEGQIYGLSIIFALSALFGYYFSNYTLALIILIAASLMYY